MLARSKVPITRSTPNSLASILITLLATSILAQNTSADQPLPFDSQHQAGVRIGAWANLGDIPPELSTRDNFTRTAEISDANFYFEGFGSYRLTPALMLELSLGIVSRGDVLLHDDFISTNYIGNLQMYPILAKVKFYPLGPNQWQLFPYLMAGGGVYYAKHNIQFASGPTVGLDPFFDEDSEVSLGYVLGGGIDWPLASVIGLELQGQYMPIDFSDPLIEVRDWSSFTITVGAKYLFEK